MTTELTRREADRLICEIAYMERHPMSRLTVWLFDRCDATHGANIADYEGWRDQHSCWLGKFGCWAHALYARFIARQVERPPAARSTRHIDPDYRDAVTKGIL